MHYYKAQIEVACGELSRDEDVQVRAALRSYEPCLGTSVGGLVEVGLLVAAESLVEATMVAVSAVWTAVGAEPVRADIVRELTPDTQRAAGSCCLEVVR
jgi:hypothetical protein